MTRRSCELAAVATWFAIVTCGTTDCLAMNSYSSITGTLHVDGAYSVGDVVYDIDLQKNSGDPGQLLVGDGFVLQAAIQSTRPTSVPSVFSGDTGILRVPVVAVTDGGAITQYLTLELSYAQNTFPMQFNVKRVFPSDVGQAPLVWRGPYVNGTPYKMSDVVTANGESYVCSREVCSARPPQDGSPMWNVLAVQGQRGDTGEKGDAGPIGPPGPQGAQGPQGAPGLQGAQGPQGPQGPQGSTGISGYEMASLGLLCQGLFDCVGTARCPGSKVVLGGGVDFDSDWGILGWALSTTYPVSSPGGWKVRVTNLDIYPKVATVWVVCALTN